MLKSEFLHDIQPAWNHRSLLWLALELTQNDMNPIGEFGAGSGSTPFLQKYCQDANRNFISYDSNKGWAEQWGASFVNDWNQEELYVPYSVVLIDQAPGEYRHISMVKLKDLASIIVVHDAEPDYSMGYRLEEIWGHFKYRVFHKGEKIWSAAISNSIDLTKHDGTFIENFKIEI